MSLAGVLSMTDVLGAASTETSLCWSSSSVLSPHYWFLFGTGLFLVITRILLCTACFGQGGCVRLRA